MTDANLLAQSSHNIDTCFYFQMLIETMDYKSPDPIETEVSAAEQNTRQRHLTLGSQLWLQKERVQSGSFGLNIFWTKTLSNNSPLYPHNRLQQCFITTYSYLHHCCFLDDSRNFYFRYGRHSIKSVSNRNIIHGLPDLPGRFTEPVNRLYRIYCYGLSKMRCGNDRQM